MSEASERLTKLRVFLAGPIARATLLSLAIRLGSIALGVGQAVLTARLLGPEGYGAVAYVFSLSMVLATFALFGTDTLAVREVARLNALGETAALGGLLRSIRWLVLGTALGGAGVVAMALPFATTDDAAFRAVIIFPVLLFPVLTFVFQTQGILRGFGRVAMSQVPFQIVRPAITVTVLVLAWMLGTGFGPRDYMTTAVAAASVALAVALFALARQRANRPPPAASPSVRQIVTRAAPFFSLSALGLLMGEANTLMLAWWSDAEQTGLFQPIARIAPLMMMGVEAAGVAYAPRISALWSTNQTELLARITRTFTWTTTAFAVVVSLLILLLGEWILGLFGEAFASNVSALWWVAGAQVFNAACGPVGMLLAMSHRAGKAVGPQIAGLLISVVLGYLFIPGHGAYGAAIAMSGGIVAVNLGMLIVVRMSLRIDPSIVNFRGLKRQSETR